MLKINSGRDTKVGNITTTTNNSGLSDVITKLFSWIGKYFGLTK